MYQVNWTKPVLDTLVLLHDHRVEHLPKLTLGFLKQLTEATRPLNITPERGHLVFETDYQRSIRELLFNDFRIIYRTQTHRVDTLAVILLRSSMCANT